MSNIIFEITGLKPGEHFTIKGHELVIPDYWIDEMGVVWTIGKNGPRETGSSILATILTETYRIIRKPTLTGEQVAELKALATLGLRYTTKSHIGQIISHGNKPRKMETHWASERSINEPGFIHVNKVLGNLVSWSDPEPLNIVQTLKDAGVEV